MTRILRTTVTLAAVVASLVVCTAWSSFVSYGDPSKPTMVQSVNSDVETSGRATRVKRTGVERPIVARRHPRAATRRQRGARPNRRRWWFRPTRPRFAKCTHAGPGCVTPWPTMRPGPGKA